MEYFRACLVMLLLTAFAACNSSSKYEAIDTAAEVVAITQLETEWSEMFGARDLDGVAALMAQNTVLIMPGSEPIVGVDDVRAATEEMLKADGEVTEEMLKADGEVSWASDFAFVAPSGDMAYDYGTATTKLADASIVKGKYLVVWVKEHDQWKIAAEMFN